MSDVKIEKDIGGLNFTVGYDSDLYEALGSSLKKEAIDDLETYRELSIMHNVQKMKGKTIQERMDNLLKKVSKVKTEPSELATCGAEFAECGRPDYAIKNNRYKLKYKY